MDIVIKKSKIEGKGVFANRDFKKGEIVLKWDMSHQLSKDQVDKIPEEKRKYVSYFNGKYTLMQSPEKFVNHSCNSNTQFHNFCDVAKRDIKKGEEITSNYADGEIPKTKMKCNCGSKNCKGIIDI